MQRAKPWPAVAPRTNIQCGAGDGQSPVKGNGPKGNSSRLNGDCFAAYANANKENPIYIAIAKGKERQAKNVAMTDWFHPPRILEIDLRGWRGAAGQVIRVLAVDDVKVGQVHVEIADGAGTILETGPAALAATQRWEYPLRQAHSGSVTVTVLARDLPGHVTQESASKKLPGRRSI